MEKKKKLFITNGASVFLTYYKHEVFGTVNIEAMS